MNAAKLFGPSNGAQFSNSQALGGKIERKNCELLGKNDEKLSVTFGFLWQTIFGAGHETQNGGKQRHLQVKKCASLISACLNTRLPLFFLAFISLFSNLAYCCTRVIDQHLWIID